MNHYLLRSDKDAARIVKALSEALPIKPYYPWNKIIETEVRSEIAELTMKYVPDDVDIAHPRMAVIHPDAQQPKVTSSRTVEKGPLVLLLKR